MSRMGFYEKWIRWTMMCVDSVSYGILLGGNLMSPIILRRGIRRGDPLSPYLFILCLEGLSVLIKRKEAQGLLHGV